MKELFLLTLVILPGALICNHAKQNHKNCNQRFEGWSIQNKNCVFRRVNSCRRPQELFRHLQDCQMEVEGCAFPDICNHGFCVSIRTWTGTRSYKCVCDGTGYYGKNCKSVCPRVFPRPRNYPFACIQI